MNTHQVLLILIVDTRVLSCVADSLQERRFSSISPTDYKDTKASIFRSEVIGITVAHDRRRYGDTGVGMPLQFKLGFEKGSSLTSVESRDFLTLVYINAFLKKITENHWSCFEVRELEEERFFDHFKFRRSKIWKFAIGWERRAITCNFKLKFLVEVWRGWFISKFKLI